MIATVTDCACGRSAVSTRRPLSRVVRSNTLTASRLARRPESTIHHTPPVVLRLLDREVDRDDAAPYRQVDVLRLVLGWAGADLGRRFVERQGEDRGGLQLERGRLPSFLPAAGSDVLGEQAQRLELLLAVDLAGVAEDDDRAVVDGVVEDRLR